MEKNNSITIIDNIGQLKNISNLLKEVNCENLQNTENEIKDLMKTLGKVGIIQFQMPEYFPIVRIRKNYIDKDNDVERFETRQDYSFVPKEKNNKYARASSPQNTMFYGVIPNSSALNEITSAELCEMEKACFAEISYNGFDLVETPKISIGRWEVKANQQLNLIAIIQEDKFTNSNILCSKLNKAYQNYISSFEDESFKKISLEYTTFLANEFSKPDINHQYDYMISAIYTEFLANQQVFDGIIYPSVRADGAYFNIALTPNAVNKKLNLKVVGERPINKTDNGISILECDHLVYLKGDEESFTLQPRKILII